MADTPKQFVQFLIPDIKPESNIVSFAGGSILQSGVFKSPNYTKGQSGWQVDAAGNADFQSVSIRGYAVATIGTFGGDGTDGELNVKSGTTTLDLNNAKVVVFNFTSISITGTGSVNFSNPHANGTVVIIKSQGDVTITSSTAPCLDASGLGAAGGSATTGGGGNDGNDGTDIDSEGLDTSTHYGAKGISAATTGAGGAGGTAISSTLAAFLTTSASQLYHRTIWIKPGAGGGSGANGAAATDGGGTVSAASSPAGGRGGGALYIECGGSWNFTTTNGISVAGASASNTSVGTGSGNYRVGGSGGSAGGNGGQLLALYGTLTANSGTVNVSGGNGGNGGNAAEGGIPPVGTSNGGGGGGGGAGYTAGGAGGQGAAAPANGTAGSGASGGTAGTKGTNTANAKGGGGGGGGGTGSSLIAQNKWFA